MEVGEASFFVPALFVVGILFLLINIRNSAATAIASLTQLLPIGYAFAAGMVAGVNPCGFLMLPSYMSYHLGTEESGLYKLPAIYRVLKALLLGAVATLSFVVLFATVGGIIAAGGYWLVSVFPYSGVAIGVVMVGVGLWLTRKTLGITAASRTIVTPRRNLQNVFLFGIGYAVCSLGCTLSIFLVVVGSALASQGLLTSLQQFIAYSLGMGTILMAVTVGAALFRGSVARWLRGAIPYLQPMSALFLVGAGAYLIYYWIFYLSG